MSEQTPEDPQQPPQYPAYPGYGQPQDQGQDGLPAYGQPAYGYPAYGQPAYGYPAYGYPPPAPGSIRPGTVVTAHVVTWVTLAVNLVGLLVMVLAFAAADREFIQDALDDQELDDLRYDDVRTALIVIGVVLIIWALLALLVSFASFQGKAWARLTLAVSGGLSVVVQLIAFAAIVPVLTALATVSAIILLYTRDANAWYGSGQLPPYPPTSYPPTPPTSYPPTHYPPAP